jgi:hypothetical protein
MSEKSEALIRKPNLTETLAKYSPSDYNIIMPITQSASLPRGMQASVRIVSLDVKDSYQVDGGKMGLSKNQLEKLGQAAGISWKDVERKDDRREPHYYEFKAVGTILDWDGVPKDCIGNKTVDLRSDDGTGQPGKDAKGMSEKQLGMARKFGAENAATKSMLRCISAALAIKRSYTKDELAKPFIVPRLSPDTDDPQMRNLVAASAFGIAGSALYGKPVGEVVDGGALEMPPDEEEGMDPVTGEFPPTDEPPAAEAVLTVEQGIARVTAAWNTGKAKGLDAASWKAMAAKFGVQTYRDQALAEAKLAGFEAAVNGWVKT